MHSEIKILKLFLDYKNERCTIKKIAEKIGINYRIAYEKVLLLEKEGLININKAGNANFCEFTYAFDSRVFQAENERREEIFKRKDIFVLQSRLEELNFSFITLLFGSYAKRKATKHSDIDLLTLRGVEKKIKKVLALWPEKLHLTSVSYRDFIHMAKSREFSVVSEAIKNNVIL